MAVFSVTPGALIPSGTLLTTRDAARLLQVTSKAVRKFVRLGQLSCERTLSGQYLFRFGIVMQAVERRAKARIASRHTRLVAVRMRMLKAAAAGEARQLTLDFSRRLQLVGSRGKGIKVA